MTMEILNNFASIYCFIMFIFGAVFMLAMLSIAAMGKSKEEPKVRFYIKRIYSGFELWVKDLQGFYHYIKHIDFSDNYLIDTKSFEDMDYDEIRKVNLMED